MSFRVFLFYLTIGRFRGAALGCDVCDGVGFFFGWGGWFNPGVKQTRYMCFEMYVL